MIEKIRIRNVANHLFGIKADEEFFVAKNINEITKDKLLLLGFSENAVNGEQVLPSIVGPISKFNANGGFLKLKDLPKETMYREMYITDWHGNHHLVFIPYQRFQRQNIPAPSIELKIVENCGVFYIVSKLLHRTEINMIEIKHTINLFLELFGSCEIIDKTLMPILCDIPTKRVNWQILPEGESSLMYISRLIKDSEKNKDGKCKLREHYIETIRQYMPTDLIYGNGGFTGYIVFRFPKKNLFIMENIMYGNATYVFENDWEQASHLTKAEIIQNNLEKARLEHHSNWEEEIKKLLN